MATNPTLLTQPIAANGTKNNIPNTTSTPGAMSQDQGFPAETSLPLGAGGVAPSREDFNGAFNLLSGIAFYAQKGFVFNFDNLQDYFVGCVVIDPDDGQKYECILDAPAGTGAPHETPTNWKLGADMSEYTKTVNSPMFNKRAVITTSGTYTAPVTGWYKITVKGGGGGGTGGKVSASNDVHGGGGGGEGGTTIAYERMSAGDTVSVVIGAGGTGGAIGNNGSNGGDTTININTNTYVGGGGVGGYSFTGGDGGSGTITGSAGGTGVRNYGDYSSSNNFGGGSGGGNGGGKYNVHGVKGGGGGGGQGGSSGHAGGNGGDGYVWFEYFDSSLNP